MNKFLILIIAFIIFHCQIGIAQSDNDNAYEPDKNPLSTNSNFDFEVLKSAPENKMNFPACAENPPNLSACSPYVCTLKAEFGEIFVKVKGMQNGRCQYVERTFGLNGVDCQFKKEMLVTLDSLFARRYKKLSGRRIFLIDQEYAGLAKIFKTECTIIPDYNSTKLIPINKINTNELDPELNIEDLAKYSRNSGSQTIFMPKHNEDVEQEYKANLDNYRSIMLK